MARAKRNPSFGGEIECVGSCEPPHQQNGGHSQERKVSLYVILGTYILDSLRKSPLWGRLRDRSATFGDGRYVQNGDFWPIYNTWPLYPGITAGMGPRSCGDRKGRLVVPPNRFAALRARYSGSSFKVSSFVPSGLYIIKPAGANHLSSRGGSGTYIFISRKAPSNWIAKAWASISFWTTIAISEIFPRSSEIIAVFCSSLKTRCARFWISRSNAKRNRAASSFAMAVSK